MKTGQMYVYVCVYVYVCGCVKGLYDRGEMDLTTALGVSPSDPHLSYKRGLTRSQNKCTIHQCLHIHTDGGKRPSLSCGVLVVRPCLPDRYAQGEHRYVHVIMDLKRAIANNLAAPHQADLYYHMGLAYANLGE